MDNLTKAEMQTLHEEFEADMVMNEFNISDVTMRVPALKAKWLRQLWTHDHELRVLEKTLEKLRQDQSLLIRSHLKVDAKESDIKKMKLKCDKGIEKAEYRIDELKFIIEYLRMYEASVRFFGNDVGNFIQLMKLEH